MTTQPVSLRDSELQEKITALVKDLLADKAAAPRIFCRLCRLCRAARMEPEEFRKRLVEAGLGAERASEIKTVLSNETWAAQFTAPRSTVSWKVALSEARNAQMNLQKPRAAKLCGYMVRQNITEVANVHGRFRLVPLPFESVESEFKLQDKQ